MASPNSTDEPLHQALCGFQNILTPDQKRDLLAQTTIPDAAAVIILTADIDNQNAKRRSRRIATRLNSFLESVQQFTSVVDPLASPNPNMAALLWGSVKFAILAVSNFSSFFDKLSAMFMKLRSYYPVYSDYQILYPSSRGLQAALSAFYATVVQFCGKALKLIQRKGERLLLGDLWVLQVTIALWRSFETEFGSFQTELQRQNECIKREIDLASQQAAHQERQLQEMERRATSRHRLSSDLFHRKAKLGSDEAHNWRLQASERKSRKKKERLLKSLSSYDYKMAFKQACRKRYGTTCSWFLQSHEFRDWLADARSSVFWCYGIPGSGKTILTASVVDELFCRDPTNRPLVRFFFCRYDNPESLKAKAILGSLVRQCIQVDTMSSQIEADLERLLDDSPPDFEDISDLMEKVSSVPDEQLFVIDAIDECEKAERHLFLSALQRMANSPRVKIFLASGLHIGIELERVLKLNHRMSMASPDAHSDIKAYVEHSIAEKERNEELKVGQPQLLIEIRDTLVNGAQGMFLWVTFQIQDICAQGCDEDIRKVIGNLPKDLPETYERVLARINSAGTAKSAQKIFRWVAAAKRPLSLEELREAIAIQPCQPSLNLEALENDINRLVPYCGNLIVLDEEDQVVQFAHHTVKQFLLAASRTPSLDNFHFQLPHADHDAGEVCVTYLSFNDFKRQLAKISATQTRIYDPSAILRTSISTGLKVSARSHLLRWVQLGAAGKVDVERQLYDAASVNDSRSYKKLQATYALLPYASEHWLSHSSTFAKENTKAWRLWNNLLFTENGFAQMPWTFKEWTRRTQNVIQWMFQNDHRALLRHIEGSDTNTLSLRARRQVLVDSAAQDRSQFVDILIDSGRIRNLDLGLALQAAAREGHLDMVERLLAAKADVNTAANAGNAGQTALQAAAGGGYLNIVEKLLTAKADVNAAAANTTAGRTALQAAAGAGHLDVVERLLAERADVNAAAGRGQTALQAAAGGGYFNVVERLLMANADVSATAARGDTGRTAFQAAAEGGHVDVVERLLAAGADVNAPTTGWTALQAAAKGGHLDVVEILLAAKADVNAPAPSQTALQAAAAGGHLDIVEKLLAGGADVNAAAGIDGQTAFQAAAEGGHVGVVERLLAAGADVNAPTTGWTALQAAAKGGHLDVVEILLAANADVNASATNQTALQAAAGGGHLNVVERLLAAKADVNAPAASAGQTALLAAAGGGHLNLVERLIAAKANVNATTVTGRTALQAAAEIGHLDIVERLLAAKASVNNANSSDSQTALLAAAKNGHLDVVERLLAAKANVNAHSARQTALQAAAGGGHFRVVERLLVAKANVNTTGSSGQTPLQEAARGGYLDIVERLLATRAGVNTSGSTYTALQVAAGGGHFDVVESLLAAGANVNATVSGGGLTALQMAAGGGYPDIVERLIIAKADVNAAAANTTAGRTALQAAAGEGHLDIVEMLLAAKADINAPGSTAITGQTALQAAAADGHFDVVERLLAAKADVNATHPTGLTALQTAARAGHLNIVEMLLAAKADVNAPGSGRTALQAAAENGFTKIVERLKQAGAT
ncbi:MAG: hypothetical protein M1840_008006 [Geoglossum simile]|nr:MAG: hypothetical protein M1840_008006 [Geoglossum simile]